MAAVEETSDQICLASSEHFTKYNVTGEQRASGTYVRKLLDFNFLIIPSDINMYLGFIFFP